MVCSRYRPRQPRASPVWQVLHDHWEAFRRRPPARAAHRPGRRRSSHEPPPATSAPDHADTVVQAFLRCGDLHAGFTHLHCPECGHDFLLAFTCKQRGLCPSCHQRRTLEEAAFIADTVCQPVPHRHLVFTVPRLIRTLFREHRELLGELAHAAHEALTAWLRERAGCPDGQPGLVVAVQTFGDFLF
jgi:hypothetical protein